MASSIWEALGAALQTGAGTYGHLKQQQAENQRRDEQQRIQQEQFGAGQRLNEAQFAEAQKARRIALLQHALANTSPDTPVAGNHAAIVGAKNEAPELLTNFTQHAAGEATMPATPGMGWGMGMPNINAEEFYTRNRSEEEQFRLDDRFTKDQQLATDKIVQTRLSSPEFAQLPYDEQVRYGLAHGVSVPLSSSEFDRREKVRTDGDVRVASARQRATSGGATPNIDAMVEAVIANPQLYQQMTPTLRGKLIPALNARGFDFETPMAEAAKKYAAEGQSAITTAQGLETAIDSNSENMGPLKGYAGLLPDLDIMQSIFGTRDVKAWKSQIGLVRQRIGKLLEGGVLRLEDEKKYAAILPTEYDDDETAKNKMAIVIQTLEQDVANFLQQQQIGGRRVSTPNAQAGAQPGGGFPPAGTKRTFPNGRTAVSDGKGWVAQ